MTESSGVESSDALARGSRESGRVRVWVLYSGAAGGPCRETSGVGAGTTEGRETFPVGPT